MKGLVGNSPVEKKETDDHSMQRTFEQTMIESISLLLATSSLSFFLCWSFL